MLDRLLQSLHQKLPTIIQDIIRLQLENIKMLSHLLPETAILDLPEDQYYVLSTISSYLGPNDGQPVFCSMTWTLFYPLFLMTSQRQQSDSRFYQILQEV
ncbi:6955_t:CDS:2 [Funneliformis geosporum]|uniref:6955_t:CDS:1 n=1 Tax=Funneliformis geosporum TaxID=1117311 RepID=A0A9W4SX33_9GLOM|nr:6955_t:CDS:2 [Funneliformis geosporum]